MHVYNEDCKEYTSISNKPTSGTNLQWGSVLHVLVYSNAAHEFNAIGKRLLFADSWGELLTDKT